MTHVAVVDVGTWTALAVASLLFTLVGFVARTPIYSVIAAVLNFVTSWSSGMVGTTVATSTEAITVYYPSYTIYGLLFAALGVVMSVVSLYKIFAVAREVTYV